METSFQHFKEACLAEIAVIEEEELFKIDFDDWDWKDNLTRPSSLLISLLDFYSAHRGIIKTSNQPLIGDSGYPTSESDEDSQSYEEDIFQLDILPDARNYNLDHSDIEKGLEDEYSNDTEGYPGYEDTTDESRASYIEMTEDEILERDFKLKGPWNWHGMAMVVDARVTFNDLEQMIQHRVESSTICLLASLVAEKALKACYLMKTSGSLERGSPFLGHSLSNLYQMLINSGIPSNDTIFECCRILNNITDDFYDLVTIISARYPRICTTIKSSGGKPFPLTSLPMVHFTLEMAKRTLNAAELVLNWAQNHCLQEAKLLNEKEIPIHDEKEDGNGHIVANVPFKLESHMEDDIFHVKILRVINNDVSKTISLAIQ